MWVYTYVLCGQCNRRSQEVEEHCVRSRLRTLWQRDRLGWPDGLGRHGSRQRQASRDCFVFTAGHGVILLVFMPTETMSTSGRRTSMRKFRNDTLLHSVRSSPSLLRLHRGKGWRHFQGWALPLLGCEVQTRTISVSWLRFCPSSMSRSRSWDGRGSIQPLPPGISWASQPPHWWQMLGWNPCHLWFSGASELLNFVAPSWRQASPLGLFLRRRSSITPFPLGMGYFNGGSPGGPWYDGDSSSSTATWPATTWIFDCAPDPVGRGGWPCPRRPLPSREWLLCVPCHSARWSHLIFFWNLNTSMERATGHQRAGRRSGASLDTTRPGLS